MLSTDGSSALISAKKRGGITLELKRIRSGVSPQRRWRLTTVGANCWVVAKAQDVPVDEVQACVTACAAWLEANGFCYEAAESPPPVPMLDYVIHRLRPEACAPDQPRAGAVKEILIWLHWSVLPDVDGARDRSRSAGSKPAGA